MRCQICQTMVNSVLCSHPQDGLSGKWTASDFGFQMAAHGPMFSGGSGGATQFKLGFAGAWKCKQQHNIFPIDYPVIVMVHPHWDSIENHPLSKWLLRNPALAVLGWLEMSSLPHGSRLMHQQKAREVGFRLSMAYREYQQDVKRCHSIAAPKTGSKLSKRIGFLPGCCRWNLLWLLDSWTPSLAYMIHSIRVVGDVRPWPFQLKPTEACYIQVMLTRSPWYW